MEFRNPYHSTIMIPPRWTKLAFSLLFCICLCSVWESCFVSYADPVNLLLFAGLLVNVYYILAFGTHCMFAQKHLIVCFLGLPVRKIPWDRIQKALYVHAWRDPQPRYRHVPGQRLIVYGQIIYVTLDRCPQWFPRYTARWRHNIAHPIRALTIWLPYERKAYFTEEFQKRYPALEFQPLDDWKKFG